MSPTITLRPMRIGSEIIYVDDLERVRIAAYQLREFYRPSGSHGKQSTSSRSSTVRSSDRRSPLVEPGAWRRGL
jgi:hypothetical protein